MKPLRPEDPRQVGTYRVLRQLGAGGMGQVYVGRSRGGRVVAIKIVRPELADDPSFRVRFRREVDAARRVGGAWTAPVLDADPEAERPWLVTGYVPGPSLHDAVSSRGPLPLASLRVLGVGLAEALVAVHRAGLVHRDLKPSNVLLSLDGPKVIDFGISHAVDATVLTQSGVVIGSPAFMPPEQIEADQVTAASDVFALGAVLTYAATGHGPFGAGSLQTLMFRILTQPPDLDAVPEPLLPVVARCLAKAPADRPTPAQVAQALAPPGGPSALVTDGWLPPDLTNALSRRAVELLDLDDDLPGPAAGSFPPAGGSVPPAGRVGAGQPGVGRPGAGRPDVGRPDVGVQPDRGFGWPLAAAGSSGVFSPGGRTRTKPLLVVAAGVVALLVVGSIAAAFALSGDDPDGGQALSPGAAVTRSAVDGLPTGSPVLSSPGLGGTDPGTAPTSRVSPPGQVSPDDLPSGPGPLPQPYVGTWEGTITSQNVGLEQNVVLVLRPGDVGQVVAAGTFTVPGLDGIACEGDATLEGVDERGIALRDVPGSGGRSGNESLCTSGGQYLLMTQANGELLFTLYEDAAGNPTGTLRRTA